MHEYYRTFTNLAIIRDVDVASVWKNDWRDIKNS